MDICNRSEIIKYKKFIKNTKDHLLKNLFHKQEKTHRVFLFKLKERKNLNEWAFHINFSFWSTINFKNSSWVEKKFFFFEFKSFTSEIGNPLGDSQNFTFLVKNMINKEKKFMAKSNYMKNQIDINKKMREILIDWLIDVHGKFKLSLKTLYLAINILDRFLSNKKIVRQKLQLLGITAMFLASKYEEIYAPEARDFVYISDNAYTKEDIFKMEALVCSVLKFDFSSPSIIGLLSHLLKILGVKKELVFLCIYFSELTLLELSFLKFSFSTIVISIIMCTKKILNFSFTELDNLLPNISHSIFMKKNNQIRYCLNKIKSTAVLGQNRKQRLGAVKRKFESKKFGEISFSTFSITY